MADLERDGYTVLPGAVPQDVVRAALRCIGLGIRHHGLPGGQGHADAQGGTFLPELRDDPAIWGLMAYELLRPLMAISRSDTWATPQILLRFPDEAPAAEAKLDREQMAPGAYLPPRPALVPHVDEEPPWAGHEFVPAHRHGNAGCIRPDPDRLSGICGHGSSDPIHVRRRYKAIVGVALTDHGPDDGALYVWPKSHLLDPRWPGSLPPVAVPLKAGDAVVLHPELAHAGSLNLGATVRTMVYFRLLGAAE